jgi:tRNA (guanine37-N1)-methyltransferase
MKFKVITLFPQVFPGTLGIGLIGKALNNRLFTLDVIDLKKYSQNGRVDDRPFGGGPGMIIRPDILSNCFDDNQMKEEIILFVSPRGLQFTQSMANFIKNNFTSVNLLCGRYEGIDERLFKKYKILEISIGDFVLCGGEIAVMTIIESIVRLLPNVLHNEHSTIFESFTNGLLEHSHYTMNRTWANHEIPEVLITGNHYNIAKYQFIDSFKRTKNTRYDLFANYNLIYIICHVFLKVLLRFKLQ